MVLYVKNISERFTNSMAKDTNARAAYFGMNKLSRFIKVLKDPLPTSSHPSVVYKIKCNDCQASYVGQTSRMLHTRIREHRNTLIEIRLRNQ